MIKDDIRVHMQKLAEQARLELHGISDRVTDYTAAKWHENLPAVRAAFVKANRSLEPLMEPDAPELLDIQDMMIAGANGPMATRFYIPLATDIEHTPTILFMHGGGFMLGDLDSHDMICRRLASATHYRILAIDYRLAPENAFPAAHNDALTAYKWLLEHGRDLAIDPARIILAGDSAGGNLCLHIARQALLQNLTPPMAQVLLYPLVQFAALKSWILSFREGFFFTPALFDIFKNAYLSGADGMDVRVSPLYAPEDDIAAMPPSLIILAGWDPLHDEGLRFADKLAAAGVPVQYEEYPGMVHGFMNLTPILPKARDAIYMTGRQLRELIADIEAKRESV